MKTNGGPRTESEESLSAVLAAVILLILPLWGATAMLVGAVIGLFVYIFLFREQLRSRGWFKLYLCFAVAGVVGAAAALLFH